MGSHEGGGPWVSQRGAGQASATPIVQARAQAVLTAWAHAPPPRSLGAAATRYTAATAPPLATFGFLPRPPRPPPAGGAGAPPSAPGGPGARTRCHAPLSGARVVSRQPGPARAGRLVAGRQGARRRAPPPSAAACRGGHRAAPVALASSTLGDAQGRAHGPGSARDTMALAAGRPPPSRPRKARVWPRHAPACPDHAQRASRTHQSAGVVRGTHSDASQGSAPAVLRASTAQAQAEGGLRLLPAPGIFVSSWCVKKPCRRQGLLRVMTGALWVYAVTPRRRRHQWAPHHETLPNQLKQPTERPTCRWVFQRLAGRHRVRVTVQGTVHDLMEGLNKVQSKILRLFGEEVCRLDQISPG
jgi:hypothetical protein